MSQNATERDSWEILNTGGPAAPSLDAVMEYLRLRGLPLIPCYVVGMLPFSVLAVFIIDAISAQHRSVVGSLCLALVPATIWRWAWLARIQQLVQQDVQSRTGLSFWRRLGWILLVRLYCSVLVTWGSLTVLLHFYGLYLGSFAAPLLLEREGPALRESVRALTWVHHSAGRLIRAMACFCVMGLLLLLAVFLLQYVLVTVVLPSFLGIDATSLALTFESWAWRLSVLYFIALLLDFYWTVAAVFLYHDSQSRRTGSDLRARFGVLAGGGA